MTDAMKPAAYLAVLAALFGGAVAAGNVLGDDEGDGGRAAKPAAATSHDDDAMDMGGHDAPADDEAPTSAGHDDAEAAHSAAEDAESGADDAPAPGLAVAQDELRLVAPASLRAGVRERFAFRVVDGHGATVKDFDVEHTKRLHLIAVRRDLTGFQHLHPEQGASGAWSTGLTLREAGAYRVFADFKPSGGEKLTLASDVMVGGDFRPKALPAPSTTTRVDGYDVTLDAPRTTAGAETTLTYKVTRGGKPVAVQPYLGASGHLVTLRAGDLAYLHVHPLQGGADQGRIAFAATYPSAGRYRLFLQFKVDGRVHTAALTQEAKTR